MKLTECALAVEVAADRRHTTIVAAGWLDGYVTVEVAAYLTGVAETVPTVQRLHAERAVLATALDPHSNASNLIRPLRDAGIEVTEPSSGDVAAAHGEFKDRVDSGRLRHVPSRELDEAIRASAERRLGGAAALDRRVGGVDASPAVAAELAVWALLNAPRPQPFFAAWR